MQKRAPGLEIVFAPIELDAALPITGGEPFTQADRPITLLHFHNCLELGYCYSGSGIFMVGEKVLPFAAGDVAFINHTEVHLAQSAPGTSSEWTWIYLDPMRLVGHAGADLALLDPTGLAGPGFNNMLSAAEHPRPNAVVLQMVEELRGAARGRADALRALAWELMTHMHRLAPAVGQGPPPARPEYDRIAPALQYMATQFAQPVEIGRLAQLCHLSTPHFRRLFTRTMGQGPREYWHAVRLRMAASLLRTTSRSILEISHDTGFESLSSFNRLFRAQFHTTPRQWRRGA